jgi:alpha-ribazole phosphatase
MRNWAENQIEIYFIRHGATQANEEHRYLGRTDLSLSAHGRGKLAELAEKKTYPAVDAILTSPMARCRESAEILYPAQPLLEVPEWCEMDFGDFEMKNYEELNGNPAYQRWVDSGGSMPFPGGEDRASFVGRVVCGMENAAEYLAELLAQRSCPECRGGACGQADGEVAGPGLQVAAVVHGGTIMALLSHYCGGDYFDYHVENGGGYRCSLRLRGESIIIESVKKL